jgi:hypothetical protein
MLLEFSIAAHSFLRPDAGRPARSIHRARAFIGGRDDRDHYL